MFLSANKARHLGLVERAGVEPAEPLPPRVAAPTLTGRRRLENLNLNYEKHDRLKARSDLWYSELVEHIV